MNHRKIEAENIPEKYVRGKLNQEDNDAFEQHLLQCSRCLERVQSTELLLSGLRQLATDDESWSGAYHEPKTPSLPWPRSKRTLGLIAVLVLLVALPVVFKFFEINQLRADLTQVQQAWDEASQQAREDLELRLDSRERKIAASKQRRLEVERPSFDEQSLEAEHRADELRDLLNSAGRPQANTPVFRLPSFADSPQIHDISLPAEPSWIVLIFDPGTLDAATFRANLTSPSEGTLWSIPELRPDYRGLLNLSLHSSTLPPGDYDLRLLAETDPATERSLKVRFRLREI